MLGGPVYIALIRFAVTFAGVVILYSAICESRFGRTGTILCNVCFGLLMTALSCIWYWRNQELYVRIGSQILYLAFAAFSFRISRGTVWVKIYKLVLVFYLMAAFTICAIEISNFFFGGSVWADILLRILLVCLIAWFLLRYVREPMEGFGSFVEKEADRFSVAVMIICILFGIGYILNPDLNRDMNFARIFQILTNFLLTGMLQLLVFRIYLHVGKEKEYERENQLIQMNNRLLERQMELLEDSVESSRRIRHDARHHNAVMAEYARRGQNTELLQYLQEYEEKIVQSAPEMLCANIAVNNILTVYTRKARSEGIEVSLEVGIGKNLGIPGIDLVAILANAYENAIYACMELMKHPDGRRCFIHVMLKKKKQKLIILFENTCRMETELKDGKPKTEFTGGIGVSSIVRTAEKYGGDYDFKNDQGVFVFRLVMNAQTGRFV